MNRRLGWLLVVAALAGLVACGESPPPAADAARAKSKAARETGVDAVAYGLSLVIMDITRQKPTNVAKPGAFLVPGGEFNLTIRLYWLAYTRPS